MKFLIVAALVAIVGSASAATPTEAYLAAKEKAVAALKHPEGTVRPSGDDKVEADAVLELASLIRNVVDPISVRGFPVQGESNIISLSDGEMESGYVDGIRVASPDGISLLVTTLPLLQSWLKLTMNSSEDVGSTLQTGAFYTQAVASDAAVNIYGGVPIAAKPGEAAARAFMIRKAQDYVSPLPPDGLIVSVIKGGKVFIFDKPIKAAFPEIAACKTAWDAENKQAQALFAAKAQPTAPAFEKAQAVVDKADTAFLSCYGKQAVTQPFFPALVRQAQELADRLQ